jgi:hypothetical protein
VPAVPDLTPQPVKTVTAVVPTVADPVAEVVDGAGGSLGLGQ